MQASHELYNILPEHIISEKPEIVAFLDAYFIWLEQDDNPAHVLNTLIEYRDIDKAADEFLEYLQREIAVAIPENIQSDRRKLYKNVVDIYLSKGSIPSYQALFNLAFSDEVELFFPRVDILKPSDGKWDATNQRWKNDDGKLSVKKYIQDSRYYQSFSYVIKTGQTIDYWRDVVKRLLHPAGFAFFGQVSIFSEATKAMPTVQPGRIDSTDEPIPVFGPVVRVPISIPATITKSEDIDGDGITDSVTRNVVTVDFEYVSQPLYANGPTWLHVDQYKFLDNAPISEYSDYTVELASSGAKISKSVGSTINIIQVP